MPHTNLQEFIRALEAAGDLRRIAAAVDPRLEITEIADRVSKAGGPALLFENVTGSSFPLLINAFGSFPRMERALNCASFDEIARKIETLVKVQPPQGIMDKVRLLFTLKDIAGIMPKKVKSAPCQANVIRDERLLDHLPILTCWPGDGGPFVTLPIVITKDPDTGIQNAGMYRMQKFDARSTGMHWQYNKDGARHYEKFKALGKRMEVAVALGGSPAVTYAA
ncbi:MAG TPA: UbiD family decarboxylase, partial [Spirochaetota bacterium]|nr:UbiD family decarboxylase [Spirochaetota bacterium]